MAVPTIYPQQKFEDKKYGNFTVKKFDSRFISAVRFASRLALAHLLCTSTEDASGCPGAERRLFGLQQGRRNQRPSKPHHRRRERRSWLAFAH
jgi:hypothetical protein